VVAAILFLTACWIALSRSLDPWRALIGLFVALGIVLLQRRLFPRVERFVWSLLKRPGALLRFAATLVARLIVSTLHTSWLILTGREEGRFMALPLGVSDPLGQFLLLNSVTLTPSTISLLVEGDVVYLHWLQSRGGHGDWRAVKESIERRVLDLFPPPTDADD
jgi:multisubunit Na+/H+ antiporter MnhE subunit